MTATGKVFRFSVKNAEKLINKRPDVYVFEMPFAYSDSEEKWNK